MRSAMDIDEENPVTTSTPRKPTQPQRTPLVPLSKPIAEPPAIRASTKIPPSSGGEFSLPRDWILPIPRDKPDYGPLLNENGEFDIDLCELKQQMMRDLPYGVEITHTDSTLDISELPDLEIGDEEYEPIDPNNILAELDLV